MKIRTKIIFPIIIVLILGTALASFSVYYFVNQQVEKDTSSLLQSVLHNHADLINSYLQERENNAMVFASLPFIETAVVELDAISKEAKALGYQDQGLLDYEPYQQAVNKYYDFVKNYAQTYGYEDVMLLSPNGGRVLLSLKKTGDFGTELKENGYDGTLDHVLARAWRDMKQTKQTVITSFDKYAVSDNQPFMFIVTPALVDDHYIGSIALQISNQRLNELVDSGVGLGQTGQTYLVDANHSLITDLRFEQNVALDKKIETEAIEHCFFERSQVEHNQVEIMKNYNGVDVFNAHHYLPDYDWCLIAEKSKVESLQPLIRFNKILVVIVSIFVVGLFIILLLVVKKISQSIINLKKGAEIITQGDLNYKVGTNRKDEVGDLSRAFDLMTTAIKKSRADVDSKVEVQTKDIMAQKKTLEQQQQAVLNILDDVEEEKENVSLEKDKIEAILQSIGDAVFVVDASLRIIMVNQITIDLCGYSREELMNKPYYKVLRFIFEKDGKVNDIFIKTAIATGQVQEMANHTLLVAKDGRKIPVADSAAPLKNKAGEVIGCVVVFRDVTHEREVDKMKTEFVSLASHQLQTPLTAMRWSVEEITGGELSNEEKKEYLHDTLDSVIRLSALVNNLLNIARLESGRMSVVPKPVDLTQLIAEVIDKNKKLAQTSRVKVRFFKPKLALKKIKLDASLITEVVNNLLTNAIKYSGVDKANKEVKVKIVTGKEKVVVSIADNGIGIPRKDQKRIFEKFYRADNAVKKVAEGNGLGLYLAKMIIEASGGELWFESNTSGTTFFVSLPLAGSQAKAGEKGLA